VGVTLALNGTVSPANATNQAIVWSVKTDGGTGASITGNTLSTTGIGIVALTATIADGTAVGTNYTQDFNITIIRPVTNITGVATSGTAGTSLTLAGTVAPTNATNQTITWSVKTPGGTGASITGNTLSTTGAGTVEVTATIADGTAAGTDYTQDFNITILSLPAYTLKPVPAGTVTSGMAWGSASNYPLPQTVSAFYMGETEITYELYEVVYTWATDTAARGANVYILPDPGRQGGDSTLGGGSIGTNQHPVTTIRWRDAVVWCNAYSEMSGKTPVYQYGGAVLRESEIVMPAGYGKAENSTQDPAANGYRLPTEAEWEYAARGGVPGTGTPWTYIYAGSDNKNEVAVYSGNSGSQTAAVKSMTGGSYNGANSLGLYDMSGNVCEMCWDVYSTTYRVYRGGGWNDDMPLADRTNSMMDPIGMLNVLGFRVVCAP
jgi:formylglycine-generating enzyme required for sulfatase activity